MLKEFKAFAMRGNVMDMAVGIIIGAAFGRIITSLVSDIMMPPIGLILGKVDFSSLFLNISGKTYATLAAAKAANAATINYGIFLNTVIDFLIVAFVIFLRGAADQPMEQARAGACGHHQGMPVLRFGDSDQGDALPELHFGTARELRVEMSKIGGGFSISCRWSRRLLRTSLRLPLGDFALHFGQREVDDIVVVDFLARQIVANSSHTLCSRSISFGREPRSVRAQIEDLFLAGRREDLQRNARTRLGHSFPGEADFARLLGDRRLRGTSSDDRARCNCGGAQDAFPEIVRGGNGQPHGLAFLFGHRQNFRETAVARWW